MKQYVSANEFARIVNKDPKTVIAWIKKHLIPGTKRLGKIYQIPAKEITLYHTVSEYPSKK